MHLPPQQIAAYTFGIVNACVVIALFFIATKNSNLPIYQRIGICLAMLSGSAYLALRLTLMYMGI